MKRGQHTVGRTVVFEEEDQDWERHSTEGAEVKKVMRFHASL